MNEFWPKSINALPEKFTAAIADISDERNNGDGWWVYLKEPFFNDALECRIIHEAKLSDCIKQLKSCVNNPITKEQYFSKNQTP